MSEKTTYVYNYDEPRITRLEAENASLKAELAQLRQQLDTARQSRARLVKRLRACVQALREPQR